jgi:hypothetical protein
MPREDLRERALPGAVRPHDGVHFARLDGQVDSTKDFVSIDRGVKIPNL